MKRREREEKQEAEERVRRALADSIKARIAQDKRQQAMDVLRRASGINGQDPATMRRRALANTHPDKGGSAEQFRQVQQALEVLGL